MAHVSQKITTKLQQAEEVIEQGLISYKEAGKALMDIRDEGLYKQSHDTFEAYLKERWNWERTYAHRLIEAAKVADNLLPMGNIPNERQARELTKLPTAEFQRAAYGVAETIAEQNKAGKVTAKDVKNAVEIVHKVIQDNPSIKPEDIAAKAVEHGATTGIKPHEEAAPVEDDGAPSDEEISNAIKEHDEEIESMRRICESEDKIASALGEAKRYREQLRIIESRNNGLMGELSAAKKKIASLERKIAKMEKVEKDDF